MLGNPYERFNRGDLILRDELAIDRTILANERTLLAYVRTALAVAITGAGIIKFFVTPVSQFLGWSIVVLAVGVAALGVARFRRVARRISMSRMPPAKPETE